MLIYLDVSIQKRLISIFHYALNPGRFLMLGPAETAGHQDLVAPVDKKWRVYRKTPVREDLVPAQFSMDRSAPVPPAMGRTTKPGARAVS